MCLAPTRQVSQHQAAWTASSALQRGSYREKVQKLLYGLDDAYMRRGEDQAPVQVGQVTMTKAPIALKGSAAIETSGLAQKRKASVLLKEKRQDLALKRIENEELARTVAENKLRILHKEMELAEEEESRKRQKVESRVKGGEAMLKRMEEWKAECMLIVT